MKMIASPLKSSSAGDDFEKDEITSVKSSPREDDFVGEGIILLKSSSAGYDFGEDEFISVKSSPAKDEFLTDEIILLESSPAP